MMEQTMLGPSVRQHEYTPITLEPVHPRTSDPHMNIIHYGDNQKVMQGMDSASIDIVVTSPPYNLNIKYNTHCDNLERGAYLSWLSDVFQEINRILKPSGSFFLNVGASSKDPWVHMDVANVAREYFTLQNDITWVKSIAVEDVTYGHFKPINSKRFLNHTYEHVFHFTKNGDVEIDRKSIGVPYMHKSNIARWKHGGKSDLRCKGNCWFIPYDTICNKDERGKHPATFPEQLAEHCIKLHGCNAETVVLDPFSGTGTTLVAAKKLGAHYIGIDVDKEYIEYANKRLKK